MEDYTSADEEDFKATKTMSQNLHDKFQTLEKEYDIFTKSSSNKFMSSIENHNTRRISSSHSCYHSTPLTYTTSKSDQVWKVRTNELAKEEIKRDRKLAFENGELKGRRLFEGDSEVGIEDDEEYQIIFPQVINNGEKGSYSYNNNACGEMEKEEVVIKQVMNEQEKGMEVNKFDGVIKGFGDGLGNKSIIFNIFIALLFISFVLGICLRLQGYESGVEVILLPT